MTAAPSTSGFPRVLHVDTTFAPQDSLTSPIWAAKIDYRAIARTPRWWRRLEEGMRLDFALAREAMARSGDFDVLLCGSEKVGIPLALLGCRKPMVTVVHNLAPRAKAAFIKTTGVTRRWSRIGVYCRADAEHAARTFGYPLERTFSYCSAPTDRFAPGAMVSDGIILSAGSARRDYRTLVAALRELPGHQAEIYAASRFGDPYRGAGGGEIPPWVRFLPRTPHQEIRRRLVEATRFVVVPVAPSTQAAAGTSSILEASAASKAVIATRTLGAVDYVIDGETGLLVPPGDATAMGDAIRELWRNPALAHRMGRAGRKLCEERFAPKGVDANVRLHLIAAHRER